MIVNKKIFDGGGYNCINCTFPQLDWKEGWTFNI